MGNVVAFRRGAKRFGAAGTSSPRGREPATSQSNRRWALRAACAALAAILAAVRLPAVIALRTTELVMIVAAGGTFVGWLMTDNMRWTALVGAIVIFLAALSLRHGGNGLLKLCRDKNARLAPGSDEKNPDG